jgi:hypothetical protein
MKFITFVVYDVAKFAEVAKASDKNSKMSGQKLLAMYGCMGKAFDGQPPNTILAISIRETESAEALGSALLNLSFAGATAWAVPVMEMPIGSAEAEVKKYTK